jgi:hypothetical protein
MTCDTSMLQGRSLTSRCARAGSMAPDPRRRRARQSSPFTERNGGGSRRSIRPC